MGEQTVFDLALEDGDLAFANRDLSVVSGVDMVTQSLQVALRLFRGEWFLDAQAGVPYFQEILKKGVSQAVVDAIFRKQILAVDGVNRILTYESEIDAAVRSISIEFTVDTVYGPVTVSETLV